MSSSEYVAACLDAMGCIDISDRTFGLIAEHASSQQSEPTNEDRRDGPRNRDIPVDRFNPGLPVLLKRTTARNTQEI